MRVISEADIRATVHEQEALQAAEIAFRAIGLGHATVPAPLALAIESRGELHVKCAYLRGSRFFVVKAATGFYDNPKRGRPSGSGLLLLFDAETGFPLALLEDNGYLTEMRTAAAGTLAVRLLAHPDFQEVAVIGAGTQARYQLRSLASAFQWPTTRVWARNPERAAALCSELRGNVSSALIAVPSAEAAVRGADVVLTVTSSTEPLVRGDWLHQHATVIAVGSDSPEKRELDDAALARADKIVVDSVAQCERLGELHHALTGAVVHRDSVYGELGEIVVGAKSGRSDDELIICDLTGVGAQDATIAELTYLRLGMGRTVARDN